MFRMYTCLFMFPHVLCPLHGACVLGTTGKMYLNMQPNVTQCNSNSDSLYNRVLEMGNISVSLSPEMRFSNYDALFRVKRKIFDTVY